MSNSDECTILSGLLDFYSDRATTHASFVVAATFGIYTLLFSVNISGIKSNFQAFWTVMAIYIPLAALDIYSFLNFNQYASIAQLIQEDLLHHRSDYKNWTTELYKNLKKHHLIAYGFTMLKRNKCFRVFKNIMLPLGIFLTAILPIFFVIKFVWT